MPVRVNIVGANKAFDYPDGANTRAVKEDLHSGFGMGILMHLGIGVLSIGVQ
jgi:hypothetical protein